MRSARKRVERSTIGTRHRESEAEQIDVTRGRPGRRTAVERTEAVLALLAGKASVDDIARRYGVLPATVEGWREAALAGVEGALRQGTGKSPREVELEKECRQLRAVVSDLSIRAALMERALKEVPSRPARSRR